MATLPTTAERLAAYRAAETAILTSGQEVRMDLEGSGQQVWRGADLGQIQTAIKQLERQLAAEMAATTGAPRIGGLGFAVARLDGGQ